MPFLTAANAWLLHIHPVAPWALLTLGVFLAIYASRKFFPKLWAWFDSITPDGALSHVIQGLPAVGLGAIIGVIADGGDFAIAWKGAIAGAIAPVLHLILRALPVPYQGAVKSVIAKAGLIVLVALLTGCGGSFEEVRSAAIAQHRSMVKLGAPVPARDDAHCASVDHRHETFVYTAWGTGLSAGATGTVAGVIQGSDDTTKEVRIGLGVASGILATAAAVTTVAAANASTEWAKDCGSGP